MLIPNLGDVVFRYGYREAVRDGVISRFALVRVQVAFTGGEKAEYDDRSEGIKSLLSALKSEYPALRGRNGKRFFQVLGDLKRRHPEDERFEQFTALANARRDLVHRAHGKLNVIKRVAAVSAPERRVLCFHERIDMADELATLIAEQGHAVATYHSQIEPPLRARELARFAAGNASWMVACRSLDEGIDIPAVDMILIAAGSKAARQVIQRLGRALRRTDDKSRAAVILLEVAGIDQDIIEQDDLEDLREAADEVVDLRPADIAGWIEGESSGLPAVVVEPRSRDTYLEKAVAAVRRIVRGPSARSRRADRVGSRSSAGEARRGSERAPPWTGSPGLQSYYDKDSSPD